MDRPLPPSGARGRRTGGACAAAVVILMAVGCSGDDEEPIARPSAVASTVAATRPASARPSASPTRTPSAPPRPTPMSVAGAFLRATSADAPVMVEPEYGCFDAYPGMLDVSCDSVRLAGGSVLWIAGTEDQGDGQRRRVIRLHTFESSTGGYQLRFVARDPAGGWTGFKVGAAPLTGHGVDAMVVQTNLAGDGASYDVLTWREGGPLVLRAHRAPARQLRVVAREQRLDDYQVSDNPRFFVYRRLTWDGARIMIADYGRVPASKVPPPA
ncbi:MAG TPA: hypothetical protein VNA12_06160 [Mycobacteriales bacterium]|nr:hypothetical protein [Mycobacteriales bacterium]